MARTFAYNDCGCAETSFSEPNFITWGYSTGTKYPAYSAGLNCYLDNTIWNSNNVKFWYFHATAFLVEEPQSRQMKNDVFWYVALTFPEQNTQIIREFSYSFATASSLTSYAVS